MEQAHTAKGKSITQYSPKHNTDDTVGKIGSQKGQGDTKIRKQLLVSFYLYVLFKLQQTKINNLVNVNSCLIN